MNSACQRKLPQIVSFLSRQLFGEIQQFVSGTIFTTNDSFGVTNHLLSCINMYFQWLQESLRTFCNTFLYKNYFYVFFQADVFLSDVWLSFYLLLSLFQLWSLVLLFARFWDHPFVSFSLDKEHLLVRQISMAVSSQEVHYICPICVWSNLTWCNLAKASFGIFPNLQKKGYTDSCKQIIQWLQYRWIK